MKRLIFKVAFTLLFLSCNGTLLLNVNDGIPVPGRPLDVYLRGVWVVGGQEKNYFGTIYPFGNSKHVAQLDVFDPVTETWYPAVTQLPIPVTFAGVAMYKGKIYVSGGWNSKGQVQDILQIYNVYTDTWSVGNVMPARRAGHYLVAVERGFLYATAGLAGDINATWGNSNTYYLYNTYNGFWTTRSAVGVTEAGVVNMRGIIHSFGGRGTATNQWNNHDAYFPQPTYSSDAATGTTEVARAYIGPTAATWTSPVGVPFLLSLGGITGNLTGTNNAYVFWNLTSTSAQLSATFSYLEAPFEAPRVWTDVSSKPLPAPMAFGQGITVGNTLYIFGGTKALPFPSGEATVYKLDLTGFPNVSSSWTTGPAMPKPRFGHRVVVNLEI